MTPRQEPGPEERAPLDPEAAASDPSRPRPGPELVDEDQDEYPADETDEG